MSKHSFEQSKIRLEHTARAAFVYFRQSSLEQVRRNRESQRRQYGFAEQARMLGWSEAQVVIIDEDQGKSGATPGARAGFGRLMAAVAQRQVGIVMSLGVSRLSRNDTDWQHLIHLCRWTETLIADEHGIYDPTCGPDRMVLGIRGQVSELERDSSVHRMAVADATRRVFEKFDELGTGRHVFAWWFEQGLPFPVRRLAARRQPTVWAPVTYRAILSTLHHPFYAGAYVFGRTETRRELDPENPQRVVLRRNHRKSRDEWPVLIPYQFPEQFASEPSIIQNGSNYSLDPGSYGHVSVQANSRLELTGSAGGSYYYFTGGLRIEPGSVLPVDNASGPVFVFISPGLPGFPNQTVFLPEAFDALNSSATFRTIGGSF